MTEITDEEGSELDVGGQWTWELQLELQLESEPQQKQDNRGLELGAGARAGARAGALEQRALTAAGHLAPLGPQVVSSVRAQT